MTPFNTLKQYNSFFQGLKTSWLYREDMSGLSKIIIAQRETGVSTIMTG